ncbi:MAG: YfbM family protein [Phycisphaerae bacterium]|nr:YfbM family protein [Phycisphaerae bacterium]
MGMRLQYVSIPDSSVERLRREPDLAPSLFTEELLSAAPAGLLERMQKQLSAMGLGNAFPRLVRDDDDDRRGSSNAGHSATRPDAVRGGLEKAWHGLHFVFTGRADEAPAPFGYLLSGGEEMGEDLGYGPARYLTLAEVGRFRDVLLAIGEQEFDRRFDLAALEQNDIYPGCWDEDRDELLEEYTEYFDLLKAELGRTVDAGEGLLILLE